MQRLRFAIVGLGQATHNIHLPALKKLKERIEVTAACDPDPQARDRAAEVLPSASIHQEFAEVLELGVDAVVLSSPPAVHAEQAIAALQAGLHVFCEKPVASDLAEADRMLLAADEAGKVLAINGQFPDMEIHRAARAEVGSPRFGRLLSMQVTQAFRTSPETEQGWRKDAPRRVAFDFGVHLFDLAACFFNELPSSLVCSISSLGTSVEEASTIIALEFPSGGAASFVLNRVAAGKERYLDLKLTGVDSEVQCSIGGRADLEVGISAKSKLPYARARFAMGGTAELTQAGRTQLLASGGSNPFAAATAVRLQAFADQISGGPMMPRSASYHRDLLALALAAYESAETGRRVEMVERYCPKHGFCS